MTKTNEKQKWAAAGQFAWTVGSAFVGLGVAILCACQL